MPIPGGPYDIPDVIYSGSAPDPVEWANGIIKPAIDDIHNRLEAVTQTGRVQSAVAPNTGTDVTSALQAEIDALSAIGGGILELGAGTYRVAGLELKYRTSIRGVGMRSTILEAVAGSTATGVILMNTGYAQGTFIENLGLQGVPGNTVQRGVDMIATPIAPDNNGGWWMGGMRDVWIQGFKGDGIRLEGGPAIASSYLLPHQFLIFEQVFVFAGGPDAHALFQSGQVGQITFIGGEYDGSGRTTSTKAAVWLNTDGYAITFIGTTFQSAPVGLKIQGARPVSLEGCYFEDVGSGITVESAEAVSVVGGQMSNVHNGSGTGVAISSQTGSHVVAIGVFIQGAVDRKFLNDATSTLHVWGDPDMPEGIYHKNFSAPSGAGWHTIFTVDVPDYDGGVMELTLGGVVSSVGSFVHQTTRQFSLDTGYVSIPGSGVGDLIQGITVEVKFEVVTSPGQVLVQVRQGQSVGGATGVVGRADLSIKGSRAIAF
jgi:hypothetical protein